MSPHAWGWAFVALAVVVFFGILGFYVANEIL